MLWNQFLYALNIDNDGTPNDDFFRFGSKVEIRQPVGRVSGVETALGPYLSNEVYFGDVLIPRTDTRDIDTATEWEVGLVYGTMARSRIWIVTLPRVGIGYRVGDTGRSVVLKFSFTY